MATSNARIEANRQNALHSTGPRTAWGKERSRANAVKHGLSGAGIALPGEDAAAVEGRFRVIQEELAPRSLLGAVLAHQVALMSVRLQRAAIQESAALATRVRHAETDFDEARHDEVEAHFAAIESNPPRFHRKLVATPEGVQRLFEGLLALRAVLDQAEPTWGPAEELRLQAYSGRRPINPAPLGAPREQPGWSAPALVARIDAEIDGLRDHLAGIDLDAIEQDRAEAGHRALFDPGKEATLARRYEAAASRGLFRALREFRAVEAAAAADSLATEQLPEAIDPAGSRPASDDRPAPAAEAGPEPEAGFDPISPGENDLRRGLGSFRIPADRGRPSPDRGAEVAGLIPPGERVAAFTGARTTLQPA